VEYFDDTFSHFDTEPEFDRQMIDGTDVQTETERLV